VAGVGISSVCCSVPITRDLVSPDQDTFRGTNFYGIYRKSV